MAHLRRLRCAAAALAQPPSGTAARTAGTAAGAAPAAATAAPPPPPAAYVHAPRFGAGEGAALLEFYRREGYAIVKAALGPAEVARALDLTWEYLESAGTGLARGEPRTWHEPAWLGRSPELGSFDSTNDYYGCHSRQMWYIRSPKRYSHSDVTLYILYR